MPPPSTRPSWISEPPFALPKTLNVPGAHFAACAKDLNPEIQVIAVEPAASPVITQTRAGVPLKPGKHIIQGIGAGFIPKILNLSVIDDVVTVDNEAALETARALASREGILCGISSGAAAWAALQVAKRPENQGAFIVVMLPDSGERYLSTKLFPE